jgi:hypothetical protein
LPTSMCTESTATTTDWVAASLLAGSDKRDWAYKP